MFSILFLFLLFLREKNNFKKQQPNRHLNSLKEIFKLITNFIFFGRNFVYSIEDFKWFFCCLLARQIINIFIIKILKLYRLGIKGGLKLKM